MRKKITKGESHKKMRKSLTEMKMVRNKMMENKKQISQMMTPITRPMW